MMEIARSVLRRLRTIFRRLHYPSSRLGNPAVSLVTRPDGLRVRLHQPGVQAEWHQPGTFPSETLFLPFDLLPECEGSNGIVTFDAPNPSVIRARWEVARVPQCVEHDPPDARKLPPFPEAARNLASNEPRLWTALAHAAHATAREATRYATDHIQLRGETGQIVASDGRQLLVQSRFTFPFKENVLIPRVPLFGCKELAVEQTVAIGKHADTLTLRLGEWTFFFPIPTEGRFPKIEQVIPSASGLRTRLRLAPEDATFLVTSLPRLPADQEENAPVTVELNGQAIIRAQASGQDRPTELLLARSETSGSPIRSAINRELLERALTLGLREFAFVDGDSPMLAQDERTQYVFMPLGVKGSVRASADAIRISSEGSNQPLSHSILSRRQPPMKQNVESNSPQDNGTGRPRPGSDGAPPTAATGMAALIAEAEALKALLREGYTRVGSLLAALKRQRQQSKLLNSTMTALRQLPNIDG